MSNLLIEALLGMPGNAPPAPHPYVYDHLPLHLVNTEWNSYVGIDQVQGQEKLCTYGVRRLTVRRTFTPSCDRPGRAGPAPAALRLRCGSGSRSAHGRTKGGRGRIDTQSVPKRGL